MFGPPRREFRVIVTHPVYIVGLGLVKRFSRYSRKHRARLFDFVVDDGVWFASTFFLASTLLTFSSNHRLPCSAAARDPTTDHPMLRS